MALVAVVGNRDRLRSTARRLISDLAAGAEGLEGMTRQELEHHVGSLRVTLGPGRRDGPPSPGAARRQGSPHLRGFFIPILMHVAPALIGISLLVR